MRTASAYISKIKAETKGHTYKIQDTNSRLVAKNIYRGAAGCGPINYTELVYSVAKCACTPNIIVRQILDGGTPSAPGPLVLDGGTPATSGPLILDGGAP